MTITLHDSGSPQDGREFYLAGATVRTFCHHGSAGRGQRGQRGTLLLACRNIDALVVFRSSHTSPGGAKSFLLCCLCHCVQVCSRQEVLAFSRTDYPPQPAGVAKPTGCEEYRRDRDNMSSIRPVLVLPSLMNGGSSFVSGCSCPTEEGVAGSQKNAAEQR